MTELLYYKDAYQKEFTAVVKAVQDEKLIILDQTAFYPQGGGQPSDIGVLVHDGENYIIPHVGKKDGKILHETEKLGLKPGDIVKGEINWSKRHKIMRMHTAAHLISAIIHNNTQALITGNQLDEELSRIDFALEEFNREQIEGYIAEANIYIKKNLPVTSYFITKEQAASQEQLTKLAKGLPPDIKDIRIVQIGELDKQADGGTHVKELRELGKIELVKLENKGSKNRRLYFKLVD